MNGSPQSVVPPHDVKLEIIMRRDGRIDVNGPIENKVLCFGLLTVAEHLIQEFKKPTNAIEVPRIVPPVIRPVNG